MAIDRVRVTSVGGPGGTGYTNFYFQAVTTANLTALGALLTALRPYWPTGVTYTIPNAGDTVNETDGHLSGSWSVAAPAPVLGSGTAFATSLSGFLIEWRTGSIVDNHHPIGKTIIVPMAQIAVASNGQIASGVQSAGNAAAATFLSSTTGFIIWHRPVYTGEKPNRVLTRPGSAVVVNSGTVSAFPTVLRSRRQ